MSATTLQELLYQLAKTEERLAALQAELANTRAALGGLRERARRALDKLAPHEEAYEAYGRVYWLDDRGSICSMRLRQSDDVVLDGPETEPAVVAGPTRDFA